jgi:hypothetical protein
LCRTTTANGSRARKQGQLLLGQAADVTDTGDPGSSKVEAYIPLPDDPRYSGDGVEVLMWRDARERGCVALEQETLGLRGFEVDAAEEQFEDDGR